MYDLNRPQDQWGSTGVTEDIERRRAEAGALGELLAEAPEYVDPVKAGTTGYLLIDLTDAIADDAMLARRLLEFAVAKAPDFRLAPSWRLALGSIHGWLALDGDEQAWQPAFRWFEDARATSVDPADPVIRETWQDATDGLAELHVAYLGALRAAATDVDADLLGAFETTLTALAELAATTDDSATRAVVNGRIAQVLASRYGATHSVGDLDRAADLLAAAMPYLERFEGETDHLMLFGTMRREQYRLREDMWLLTEAIDAVTAAIAQAPSEDPDTPLRHLEMAELLALRDNQGNFLQFAPDDRDRILEHLAVAVTADLSPDDYYWYGDLLLDKGNTAGNVDDLRAAVHWLNRCLDAEGESGTDVGDWELLAALCDAHTSLLELTHDLTHADLTIDYATRVLHRQLPNHLLVQKHHCQRLSGVFVEPPRPDLATVLRERPVVEWLRAARLAVDVPEGEEQNQDVIGLLAMWVANGRTRVLISQMGLLVSRPDDMASLLSDQAYLYGLGRQVSDTPDDYRDIMDMLGEMFANLYRVTNGDRDVDLTALQRTLANPELTALRGDMSSILAMTTMLSGSGVGSQSTLRLSREAFRVDDPGLSESDRAEWTAMRDVAEALRLLQIGGDHQEIHRLLGQAREVLVWLGARNTMTPFVELLLSMVSFEVPGAAPIQSTRLTGESPWTQMVMAPLSLGTKLMTAIRARDVAGVRGICQQLDEMAADPDSALLPMAVKSMRGMAYNQLSQLDPADPAALAVAIEEYGGYVTELREVRSPHFLVIAEALAESLRRRAEPDDWARSRELALEVMRTTGWLVLVQSDPDDGLRLAARAATAVDRFIGWCVADGAFDDLVGVIDARRGLVLQAANTNQTVAQRLVTAGRVDLAEQWNAVGGGDQPLLTDTLGADARWGGLRRSVLRALADAGEDLVSPATVPDIQDALRAQGSDMFVYLVPAGEHHGGLAVLVFPDQPVKVVPLPALRTGPGSVIDGYNKAYRATSESNAQNATEYDGWRTALQDTCRWAWSAAGEELLKQGRTGRHEPTLVLCPVGMLGMVPWHAASRPINGEDRYLLQDATISYVPSGRLFCNNLRRAEIETETAVLVGNPARNLVAGAVEATAIRDAFYPAGTFLGGTTQPPRPWRPAEDGAGTPEQVADVLREPLRVLHLACHALIDLLHPLRSAIELAGLPTAALLTAKEILDISPASPLELDLVTLAVCAAQMSGAEYDEALGLSSTFLAIGARTVIGSLWPVPAGRTTAQLMFMFHHNMRQVGLPPAHALRCAQLWLLDPDHRFPPTMPARMRDMRPDRNDETAIECWAAFVHQGR